MKRCTIISLMLLITAMLFAQWHIEENFDNLSNLPTGWTIADDGDGMTWRNLNNVSHAHSGNRAAFVDNYLPNANADWLISPQISVTNGDSLFFFTRSWVNTENLKVFVSTTGNQPNQLTTQLAFIQNIGITYQAVVLPLNQFAGSNIYIGFFWQCENYGILIDDIKIGQALIVTPELNLPDEVSFFQGESLQMNFDEYMVYTDIQTVSLSVNPVTPINVDIDGLQVTFSSPNYSGTQALVFTLNDGSTGWTATDTLEVIVLPTPAIDLAVNEIISPRNYEYLNLPFTPEVVIANYGDMVYNDQFELNLQITNSNNVIIHEQTMFQTAMISPDEEITVRFLQSFTATVEGLYSFKFSVLSQDENMANNTRIFACNIVLRISSGGPDTFGYRYIDSNEPLGPVYNWIDISTTGTSTVMYNVPSWSGDDNFSEPIPLGFTFTFYGSEYSTAYVDVNGEILLAENNWYSSYPSQGWGGDGNMFNYMYPIPGYLQMPAMIAAYWDDLVAEQGIGDVYFQSFGDSPNRYTIIQWHNLRYHAGTGGSPVLKFQVILHENGEIVMQYNTVATGQSGSAVHHNNGLSATIAIQNQAANSGLCYLREIVQNSVYMGVEPSGNILHPNLAIRFYSGEDTQIPIITHKAVGNTFAQSMDLVATIIDMSDLSSAELHYSSGTGWNTIPFGTTQLNQYSFPLSNLPLGSSVQYFFTAEDIHGNSARLPITDYFSFRILPTANVQTLILYSGTQDYQRVELPIYESLLTDLSIPYDIFNWEEYPEYQIPDQYKAILAYANSGGQVDKSTYLSLALMGYLDSGTSQAPKNLWLASDGWANSQHGHPDSSPMHKLMSGYFRTSYVPTGFGGGTNGLGGPDSFTYQNGSILCLPGSPIGTPDTEYQVYANSPDCVFPNDDAGDVYWDEVPHPEIGANYVFAFEDGPINGQAYLYHGVCGTTVATPSYKTMYFSFDFSQLSNPDSRMECMEDIASWFAISPVSISDNYAPHMITGLESVYPNPFNPTTTISYSLAMDEPVSIAIYNIKGQKVTQLVQESKTGGKHNVIWNGTDSSGNSVASGIYYIYMNTKSKRETKKITLIK
ncbi:MAG: choice-of-anchor J domain-containing protein [Candidatus Cloacimonetes bacterium]|nr:choice-of-anchor J domain-containing protein [Candidatus Cloacimonadota bacterium]